MSSPAQPPILEVDNLSVSFDEEGARPPALKDVSLEVFENQILGVVGETGAGKSVLARAIIKLLPRPGKIIHGDVRFQGKSILRMTPEELRNVRGGKIALVGTNAKALLDPVERVGDQIARVLRAHQRLSRAEAKTAAIDLLDKVGIRDPRRRADSYPHQLSGGMAQRAVIAMALVAQPRVLLADDATLGLDATVQVQVLDMMVERCRNLGMSILLITHDLGIVAHYCDRVAVMKNGEIVELQPVRKFLQEPEMPYSVDLLSAAKAKIIFAPEVREDSTPFLSVLHLQKFFTVGGSRGVVRAVDDVTFSINRGETLALVGESGSGKTTTGQCLVRLLNSDGGRIIFDGQDITAMPEKKFRGLRARIQMVFQEPYVALNPRWTVYNLVSEPLRLLKTMGSKSMQRRVDELLAMVHLPSTAARAFPHELTAGEQKRVGIARALATKPELVIFDEPTTALDLRVRAQIIQLIRELQSQTNLSALFITHDLNSVRSLANYVAVMSNGKIVESGATETVFNHPTEEYTKILLAAELPIERALMPA